MNKRRKRLAINVQVVRGGGLLLVIQNGGATHTEIVGAEQVIGSLAYLARGYDWGCAKGLPDDDPLISEAISNALDIMREDDGRRAQGDRARLRLHMRDLERYGDDS